MPNIVPAHLHLVRSAWPTHSVPTQAFARTARTPLPSFRFLHVSIGQLVALTFEDAPAQLRLLLTVVIEVALMTWVIMPRLTRWLARGLYPHATSSDRSVE